MGTICAWCQGMIEKVASRQPSAPVSHGICPKCLSRQLESVQANGPARAA